MKWWNDLWFSFRDWFADWSSRLSSERSSLFTTSSGRKQILSFVVVVILGTIAVYYGYKQHKISDFRKRATVAYEAGGGYKEALKNYEALVKLNDREALFKASEMYLEGLGTSKNQKKAISYLQTAAEQGDAGAMTKLGMLYYASGFINRTCLGHNYRKAHEWFVKAGNDPDALEALGTMYQRGLGVKPNAEIAQNYFDEWINVYLVRANKGDAKAQYMLGRYFSDGIRHTIDEQKALEWYEKSAAGDYVPALETLGFMYSFGGETIKPDSAKANDIYAKLRAIYEKQATTGKTDAMIALSNMYQTGLGVEQDIKRSVEYLVKAAELNSSIAMDALVDLATSGTIELPEGFTVKGLKREAENIRERRAEQGSISLMKELGFRALSGELNTVETSSMNESYENQLGTENEVHYLDAVRWFSAAAQAGDAPAMLELGRIYHESTDPDIKNDKLSEFWFRKSAEQCYEPAYLELGALYSIPGIEFENAKEAQKWYDRAATQGNSEAQLLLAKALALGGKGAQPDYSNALKWLLVVKKGLALREDAKSPLMVEIEELEQAYSHYLTDEELNRVHKDAEGMLIKYGADW